MIMIINNSNKNNNSSNRSSNVFELLLHDDFLSKINFAYEKKNNKNRKKLN